MIPRCIAPLRCCILAVGLLAVGLAPPIAAQVPVYRIGSWAADSFGNHRAVVSVDRAAPMAWIDLPWRRPDRDPAQKSIWVVDAKTGKRILNTAHGWITRESALLFFEPVSGPGEYYIYYLRYSGSVTSNYPKLTIQAPIQALRHNGST